MKNKIKQKRLKRRQSVILESDLHQFFEEADESIPKLTKNLKQVMLKQKASQMTSDSSLSKECSELIKLVPVSLQQWTRLSTVGHECIVSIKTRLHELQRNNNDLQQHLTTKENTLKLKVLQSSILVKEISRLEVEVSNLPADYFTSDNQ